MQPNANISVLIVGAGPAGLAAAITAKRLNPEREVCVIDKAAAPGNHALSGAVLEAGALAELLAPVNPDWRQTDEARDVLTATIDKDEVMFFGRKHAVNIFPLLKMARKLGLGFGQMVHDGDYICSVSKLTAWLSRVASSLGVEVLHGFAAEDILWDNFRRRAAGVRLVDQGLNKEGHKERNYLAGETLRAEVVILAEGCDGLLSEKFIRQAGLVRQAEQLYAVGIKELIRVSDDQYRQFTPGRVVHAMGYPLWTPAVGPAMFGGGFLYPMGDNHLAVGTIVGLDYPYCDFNPQDALTRFKEHRFVDQFIAGGMVIEAGAKMIPEGGFHAIPRNPQDGAIGRGNVLLLGDSAGLVNMLKIKGLHNAVRSGIAAGRAVAADVGKSRELAEVYTSLLGEAGVLRELEQAKNFRQTVARFGPLLGMPLALLGSRLPKFDTQPDYKTMTLDRYPLKPAASFDKDAFTARAATEHREDQPCHLLIGDPETCRRTCLPKFGAPCITFCPAGVYDNVEGQPRPANPSNCLHCKTCQHKCPYDNIRWTVPEPTGGPRYKTM
jgi:electron-transferring-flavoprotein dehydrogenase